MIKRSYLYSKYSLESILDLGKGEFTQKILHYLTINDVNNLMLTNKKIYNILKTYEYKKYMLKNFNDYYLFFYQKKTEIQKLPEILSIIKVSDEYYLQFYKKAHFYVVIYYFSGCVLLLDILILFVILSKIFNHFNKILIHVPLIIFWCLSVAVLLVNYFMEIEVEDKINKSIDENIKGIDNKTKQKLIKNYSIRLSNQQPIVYKPIALIFLFCYIPILCTFIKKLDYKTTFVSVSTIIFCIFFFFDLINYIFQKVKNNREKIYSYQEIYSNEKSDYFKQKYTEIISNQKKSKLGEYMLCFLYFFWKAIIFAAVTLYAYLVGKKLDNNTYDVCWAVLLIPVDFIGVFIVLWGCLYIYSTRKYNVEEKWILYVTIGIIMLGAVTNIVLFPNYLRKQNLTPYFPFIIDVIISISAAIHYIILKRIRTIYKNKELD